MNCPNCYALMAHPSPRLYQCERCGNDWEPHNYQLRQLKRPMPEFDPYTNATADILQIGTLATKDAQRAALTALLRSYFQSTPIPNTPAISPHVCERPGVLPSLDLRDGCTSLLIRKSGEVEEWQGNTLIGTHPNLEQAARFVGTRKRQ